MALILSKARREYNCDVCRIVIKKGGIHLVKQRYGYGSDRYCLACVMKEIREVVVGNEK